MALTVALRASDMVGVYALIEKVTLEPSETTPQRVQIWGAFAFSDQKSGSTYLPAERGYLYYSCPQGQESTCRKEWADLKSMAGKTTGVGFGVRYRANGHVRTAQDKPANPDPYPIQMGVIKLDNPADRGSDTIKVIDGLRAALNQR